MLTKLFIYCIMSPLYGRKVNRTEEEFAIR